MVPEPPALWNTACYGSLIHAEVHPPSMIEPNAQPSEAACLDYGWIVVAASSLVMMVSFGLHVSYGLSWLLSVKNSAGRGRPSRGPTPSPP